VSLGHRAFIAAETPPGPQCTSQATPVFDNLAPLAQHLREDNYEQGKSLFAGLSNSPEVSDVINAYSPVLLQLSGANCEQADKGIGLKLRRVIPLPGGMLGSFLPHFFCSKAELEQAQTLAGAIKALSATAKVVGGCPISCRVQREAFTFHEKETSVVEVHNSGVDLELGSKLLIQSQMLLNAVHTADISRAVRMLNVALGHGAVTCLVVKSKESEALADTVGSFRQDADLEVCLAKCTIYMPGIQIERAHNLIRECIDGDIPLRRWYPGGSERLRPRVRSKQVWHNLQGHRPDARLRRSAYGQVLADHDTWSNPQLQALVQTHARLIQEYKCVKRQLQGPAPAAPVVDQGPQVNSFLLIPPLNQLAQLCAARAHGENAENAQEEAAQGLRMLDQRRITAAIMKYWAPHLEARALGPPHH
jgi:hypothetical protein